MLETDPRAAAERLVRLHLPEREAEELTPLGGGWDYATWLLGGDLVLRLPRARTPARRLIQEARALRLLADRLPLDVPRMRLLGTPPLGGAYPLIEGGPAALEAGTMERLGRFLRTLHAIPKREVRVAGIGWMVWQGGGRGWEGGLRGFAAQALGALRGHLPAAACARLERHLRRFLGDPENFRFEARLVHADLAPEHLLADTASGALAAVIDFGDAGLGDPALDVRPEWSAWYGARGAGFRRRQEFYRSLAPLHQALFATETRNAAALAAALDQLDA